VVFGGLSVIRSPFKGELARPPQLCGGFARCDLTPLIAFANSGGLGVNHLDTKRAGTLDFGRGKGGGSRMLRDTHERNWFLAFMAD
jgi:hypothetical protein